MQLKLVRYSALSAASIVAAALVFAVPAVDAAVPTGGQSGADVTKAIRRYVSALASGDPDTMEAMVRNSAPGSPAQAFAEHKIAVFTALRDNGIQIDATARFSKKKAEICEAGSECTPIAEFKVNKKSQKLVTFSINGGELGRVSRGDGTLATQPGDSPALSVPRPGTSKCEHGQPTSSARSSPRPPTTGCTPAGRSPR